MEKRTCQTCAHLILNGGGFYKGHPHCGHNYGPKANKPVTLDKTTCENHQTQTEKQAFNIVYTSIDCAKSGIERASAEVLHLAKQLEIAGANRTGIIKKIETRLKKLLIVLVVMTLTGCSNPIISAVDKEGDETRVEVQNELAVAKIELTEEMKKQLDQVQINLSGQMVSLLQYFNGGRL